MVTAWRLSKAEYAKTREQMMSGEGAFLYGGRWNSPGNRMIYLGSSIAQASMELLVHLNKKSVLDDFVKLSVTFSKEQMATLDIRSLPEEWNANGISTSAQNVGDNWLRDNYSLILEVPSIVVQGEVNYLLNPKHPNIDDIVYGEIEPFKYDKRIVK